MTRDGEPLLGGESFAIVDFEAGKDDVLALLRRMPPQTRESDEAGDAPPQLGIGDLCSVWRDVNGTYHLRDTKTGRERTVPLAEAEMTIESCFSS